MRKHWTVLMIILLSSCVMIQGHAQSSTELVVDTGSIPGIQPTSTVATEISEHEHFAGMVRSDSGAIFILLVNLTPPTTHSLVMFESGQFSSRILTFTEIIEGIEIMDQSLFFVEDGYFSENQSSYLIVEMDFQGTRISEQNVTLRDTHIIPKLYAGKDGAMYLWGKDVFTSKTHLVKLSNEWDVVWNKVIDLGILSWGDVQVLPDGHVYILKVSGLELRNSDGQSLWNRTLSSNTNWVPKTLHTFNDDSVCVLASYVIEYIITGGTIYRYDIHGDLLGNKTLVASEMHPDEYVQVGDLEVYDNSIISVVYYNNVAYLLEISKDLNIINRHSIERGGYIQFTVEGHIILFAENNSRYERQLLAFIFSGNQLMLLLSAGGVVIAIIVVALVWRKRQTR